MLKCKFYIQQIIPKFSMFNAVLFFLPFRKKCLTKSTLIDNKFSN